MWNRNNTNDAPLQQRTPHSGFLTPTQRVAANAKLVEQGEAVEASQTSVLQTAGEETTLSDTGREAQTLEPQPRRHRKFLRETSPPLECSPTDWWNVSGARLPRMAELACQYLCTTALSIFG